MNAEMPRECVLKCLLHGTRLLGTPRVPGQKEAGRSEGDI